MLALSFLALALAGCGKKAQDQPAADSESSTPTAGMAQESRATSQPAETSEAAPGTVPVTALAATPGAELTEDQKEMARKQVLLDYSIMEDGYINDPNAQWASAAKTSSTFGDEGKADPSAGAIKIVGKVDDKSWTNDNQTLGFDWVQATFAKPVNATAVRVVFPGHSGIEAVNKLELIDTAGTAHTIWSGISTDKADERGPRSWLVRKFDATPYKVQGVKITIANNLYSGYKEIDAVQLVGK